MIKKGEAIVNNSLLNQRYIPQRKLSEGGMGEIYLARQIGLAGFQREVVLKRIHRQLSNYPKAVEMFLAEAQLAASLTHPNIVQIYDVGEEDGTYFIVMERIQGTDLRALAEQTTRLGQMIPIELSVNIVIQILEGLRYAHDYREEGGLHLKIVHRDISPTNILLSFDGIVKIADFGIARAENQIHDESQVPPGKLAYMSPEMFLKAPIDARSDLFSIGVMLYELTVGQRLFRATNYENMVQLMKEPIPPPTFARAGYPVDLEIIVMRSLERDPEDRYASAEEMLEDLEQFAFQTGLRISRLRLGRFVSRIIGAPSSPLEIEESASSNDEMLSRIGTDELDFDRDLFERTPVMPIVSARRETTKSGLKQRPSEKELSEEKSAARNPMPIAKKALASDDVVDWQEEGTTAEMPAAKQVSLQAQAVSSVSAAPTEASVVVVTDEWVEEEIDLQSPSDDLIPERPLLEKSSVTDANLSAPSTPDQVVPHFSFSEPSSSQEDAFQEPSSKAEPPIIEASPDLLEALAEISAELKAAEESDRRREKALTNTIENLDEKILDEKKNLSTFINEKQDLSLQKTPRIELIPPQPPTVQNAHGLFMVKTDQLEQVDGKRSHPPDELELTDFQQKSSEPSLARLDEAIPEETQSKENLMESQSESASIEENSSATSSQEENSVDTPKSKRNRVRRRKQSSSRRKS